MVRLRTVACVSVGSTGRNSASTVAACRYDIILPSRAVSSIKLGRRPIGADFFQRREGAGHARVIIPGLLPAGIAHLARRVVLDRSERVAIVANPIGWPPIRGFIGEHARILQAWIL